MSLLLLASCGLVQAGTLGVLTYEIIGDEVTITDCDEAASGALAVPATIEGKPVTAIGASAFRYCRSVTAINLPDSVASIGDYAFYYCGSLTGITIPAGVTSIGSSVFRSCGLLENITIPAGVTNGPVV